MIESNDNTSVSNDMWMYGVDFTDMGTTSVLAVHVNVGDGKYDTNWIGPIPLTPMNKTRLRVWARVALTDGGYVHLFPCTGDVTSELRAWMGENRQMSVRAR